MRRFIGSAWAVTVAEATSPLSQADLATLEADAFSALTAFDKVWVVRIARSATGSGLEFSGREFDTATKRLSPPQLRRVSTLADAPRGMLLFARDLFNPTALITGEEGGRALLTVQGSMIAPASEVGAVVEKRAVFQPLRLVSRLDGKVQITAIKHTYLQVESLEGPVARCAIVSALRDPLSKKVTRPNSLVALGMKPGHSPLALRFVTGKDRAPAAGYTLTARMPPDGQPRELGTTDRAGRIVLKPGFASELVILRLISGNVEPIVELPVMPGESSEEFLISVDLKPLTAALESQLDSLRDEVVDLVALRARLESRMKARLEGGDWNGLEAELKEFGRLTPRDQFAKRLTDLKDDAAHRQADLKMAILTKTAQAQITEVQSMIDRYLDDDAFRAYTEALQSGRAEIKSKTVAEAKKKAAQKAAVKALMGDQPPPAAKAAAPAPGAAPAPTVAAPMPAPGPGPGPVPPRGGARPKAKVPPPSTGGPPM